MKNFITSYCRITAHSVCVNGIQLFTSQENGGDHLLNVYRFLNLEYPKFYKMDKHCKTGFLAMSILQKYGATFSEYGDDEIAQVFASSTGSAEVDERFDRSCKVDQMPSPALFVYTLPNILTGEIAIANKWYGESITAVTKVFDPVFFEREATVLLKQKAKAILGGWVNVYGKTDAFIYFAEKLPQKGSVELTAENLLQLYQL